MVNFLVENAKKIKIFLLELNINIRKFLSKVAYTKL